MRGRLAVNAILTLLAIFVQSATLRSLRLSSPAPKVQRQASSFEYPVGSLEGSDGAKSTQSGEESIYQPLLSELRAVYDGDYKGELASQEARSINRRPPTRRRIMSPSYAASDPSYNMVSLDPQHVRYIVNNRLYFSTIPHERIVLRYEDIRQENGLPRHLLESIRPFFPFFVSY